MRFLLVLLVLISGCAIDQGGVHSSSPTPEDMLVRTLLKSPWEFELTPSDGKPATRIALKFTKKFVEGCGGREGFLATVLIRKYPHQEQEFATAVTYDVWGDRLSINLNADYCDANSLIVGTIENGSFSGDYRSSSMDGVYITATVVGRQVLR